MKNTFTIILLLLCMIILFSGCNSDSATTAKENKSITPDSITTESNLTSVTEIFPTDEISIIKDFYSNLSREKKFSNQEGSPVTYSANLNTGFIADIDQDNSNELILNYTIPLGTYNFESDIWLVYKLIN